MVSVPLQGTYLPYCQVSSMLSMVSSFRPLAGDLSSLHERVRDGDIRPDCFRPLAGDLSSLHITHFIINRIFYCFRPLAGDLSSLPRPCNTRVSVCFHCTLRGKKKISLSSSFFSCSTSAKWPIPGHRDKFL